MTNDTEQRLQKILQGAFSGPLTPLKDIQKNERQVPLFKAVQAATVLATPAQETRGLKLKVRLDEVDGT